MNERFSPNWSVVKRIIKNLEEMGIEKDLIAAFVGVADPKFKPNSFNELERNLRTEVISENRIPWVFYDMIAHLVKNIPSISLSAVIGATKVPTTNASPSIEQLRITTDGRWQISWEIDPDAENAEDREVALDWYTPPNSNNAPIVPIHIVDYIASCVISLRQGLILPAAASLLVALESSLWYALSLAEGGTRFTRSIKYAATTWKVRYRGGAKSPCLLIEIEGADQELRKIAEVIGDPPEFAVEVRKMQPREAAQSVGITCKVDAPLVEFLTTSRKESDEESLDRGLRNAIEKGRCINLNCLRQLASQLDETLIALRNNLAHLPFQNEDDELHPHIPVANTQLKTIKELRNNKKLIQNLLPWVVEVINAAYISGLEETG